MYSLLWKSDSEKLKMPTRLTSTQLKKDKTIRNYNYNDKVDIIYCLKNLLKDFSNLVSHFFRTTFIQDNYCVGCRTPSIISLFQLYRIMNFIKLSIYNNQNEANNIG